MSNSNIIFERKPVAVKPKIFKPNRINNSESKPRKKRNDAKHNIKFMVTKEDKMELKLKAFDHNLSLTAFTSMIVDNDLIRNRVYDDFEYEEGTLVNICLDHNHFEMVKALSAEWDLPYRRVIHRIVKNYLARTSEGFQIIHYDD